MVVLHLYEAQTEKGGKSNVYYAFAMDLHGYLVYHSGEWSPMEAVQPNHWVRTPLKEERWMAEKQAPSSKSHVGK